MIKQIASSVADSLKGNPSCLAAILFAVIMAGLTYLSLRDDQAQAHERTMALLERCFPLAGEGDFHDQR